MSLQLTVPKEYGYVLLTATLTTFVSTYHGFSTGLYRRAAKVPYPNAYASSQDAKDNQDKYLFNCAQRAHANFQEHHPSMLVGLLVGGLRYPLVSAGLGVAWCAGRVLYSVGYTRRDKTEGRGRTIGTLYLLAELGLEILAGVAGYQMVMA